MKASLTVKRVIIIALSALLIAAGLYKNGFSDVKNKAVRICYECIGIG